MPSWGGRAIMIAGLAAGIAVLLRTQHQPPPPPPPPPPPAMTLPPAPVLSEAELEKVRAAVKDTDPQVRWEALDLLYRVKDPNASALLKDLLANDIDPEVKKKAIDVLQQTGDPANVNDLLVALQDHEKEVRIAALMALADLGDARASGAVTAMLKDYEPEVRMAALRTLGRFQEKRQQEYEQLAQKLRAEYERSLALRKEADGTLDSSGPNLRDVPEPPIR